MFGEDITKRCRLSTANIIRFVNSLEPGSVKFSIGKQIIDSSGSVGANIVEARFARSPKEFVISARISLKEANETIYWLELCREIDLITSKKYDNLRQEVEIIAKIISSIIRNYRCRHKL